MMGGGSKFLHRELGASGFEIEAQKVRQVDRQGNFWAVARTNRCTPSTQNCGIVRIGATRDFKVTGATSSSGGAQDRSRWVEGCAAHRRIRDRALRDRRERAQRRRIEIGQVHWHARPRRLRCRPA